MDLICKLVTCNFKMKYNIIKFIGIKEKINIIYTNNANFFTLTDLDA